MGTKKIWLQAAVLLCLSGLFSGCQALEEEPVTSSRLLLDTVCTVTLYEPADPELVSQALDLVAHYESLLSATIEGSEIWNINHSQGEPVPVCSETAKVLRLGLQYSEISQGKLDITIGQVTDLWDFGHGGQVPSVEQLRSALETVDYRCLHILGNEEDGYTVTLEKTGAEINLGAIAKGYIADQVASFLRAKGVTCALLDLGGNIVALGEKPNGQPWHIGVETPYSDRTELLGTLSLSAAAVTTSGIYERQFTQDGQIYHHILDPKTGYPVETDVVSVTVITDTAAQGDCLSTLCLLFGLEAGMNFLSQDEDVLGAVWVDHQGQVYVQGEINFQ